MSEFACYRTWKERAVSIICHNAEYIIDPSSELLRQLTGAQSDIFSESLSKDREYTICGGQLQSSLFKSCQAASAVYYDISF